MRHRNKILNVVKIGGNVIDDDTALRLFLKEFALLEGPKILVHGGGKEATRLGRALGIEANMVDGRRVTDRPTLDIVTMVYAGLINKRIVAALQALGCDAVGLTGADGNSIPARRRSPEPIDFGFVGDIDPTEVNTQFVASLIDAGKVPVFCAICHDAAGSLLNCNADSVASVVAVGLTREMPVRLIYCFEKPGVLRNISDESSVIPLITPADFPALKDSGVIAAGMLPKLRNALQAAEAGVGEVRICRAEDIAKTGSGTTIRSLV